MSRTPCDVSNTTTNILTPPPLPPPVSHGTLFDSRHNVGVQAAAAGTTRATAGKETRSDQTAAAAANAISQLMPPTQQPPAPQANLVPTQGFQKTEPPPPPLLPGSTVTEPQTNHDILRATKTENNKLVQVNNTTPQSAGGRRWLASGASTRVVIGIGCGVALLIALAIYAYYRQARRITQLEQQMTTEQKRQAEDNKRQYVDEDTLVDTLERRLAMLPTSAAADGKDTLPATSKPSSAQQASEEISMPGSSSLERAEHSAPTTATAADSERQGAAPQGAQYMAMPTFLAECAPP